MSALNKHGLFYVSMLDDDEMYWTGKSLDADAAAEDAVEHWYERGAWAGEEPPAHVDVSVLADGSGERRKVRVAIDWSPSFNAREASR
jgi:hypothetical protein